MKRFMVLCAVLCLALGMIVGVAPAQDILIGVNQFVEHPALDAVLQGFIDYLNENGYAEGEMVTYDVNYAQADFGTATLIAEKLVGLSPDLILAIATPSSQAMVNATEEIPILFSAITDPVAAELVTGSRIPVILAGGISPENVAGGIRQVRPFGVDSCTCTNAVGEDGRPIRFKKDPARVQALVSETHRADRMPMKGRGPTT